MNQWSAKIVWSLAVLAAISAYAGPGPARADDADMTAKIEAAKTPADHEAIAAEYDGLAAKAQAQATLHRKMKAGYSTLGGKPKNEGSAHCETLAQDADKDAQSYRSLAALHRGLAKTAQ